MINKYCSLCGIKVANLVSGSTMKRGAVIICRSCYDRLLLADSIVKQQTNTANSSIPDFLSGFFK